MQLMQMAAVAIRNVGARVRREAIAYAIFAVCGIAVLVLVTWASVLALVPEVGTVYAPLIVAGAYVVLALATVVWLRRAKLHAAPITPAELHVAPQQQHQVAQIAMIVEAALLGFLLSRRTTRR